MGFIDYHGNREDRYSDVIAYAQMQAALAQQKRDEPAKDEWFGQMLGNPSVGGTKVNDLLKLAYSAYQAAGDGFRQLFHPDLPPADALPLWQDLWLTGAYGCVMHMGLPVEKQEQLLVVFTEKLMKLDNAVPVSQFLEAMQCSRRYRRYLTAAFSFEHDPLPGFWRFLASSGPADTVIGIVEGYEKCLLYLTCYLYKSTCPTDDAWMRAAERRQKALTGLKTAIGKQQVPAPEQLCNPLLPGAQTQRPLYCRTLLFRRSNIPQKREEEEMVEDLYAYLQQSPAALSEQTSILPAEVQDQIQSGRLPVFESVNISGLQPGETVHYLDHMLWYREAGDAFEPVRGSLVITDRKIALRAAKNADIPLTSLVTVVLYDMTPAVMAFRSEHHTYYIIPPNPDLLYLVLKRIANWEAEQEAQEPIVPFSYEELVAKADIGACIFAFECLHALPIPMELQEKISLLVVKIKALKKAVEQHPDRGSEVERFAEYYFPEAIRLVTSYNEYQDTGLDSQLVEQIYQRISDSLDTLDAAVEEKILSIYHIETIETQAKAATLKLILEQEGYSQGKQILRH